MVVMDDNYNARLWDAKLILDNNQAVNARPFPVKIYVAECGAAGVDNTYSRPSNNNRQVEYKDISIEGPNGIIRTSREDDDDDEDDKNKSQQCAINDKVTR